MIVLRVQAGRSSLSHPSLAGLFDHARRSGRPLVVEEEEVLPGGEAGTEIVRLILRRTSPVQGQRTPAA